MFPFFNRLASSLVGQPRKVSGIIGLSAHFICVGFETRNEGICRAEKVAFIGKFDDFDADGTQRRWGSRDWQGAILKSLRYLICCYILA
jgi:hypothetical protein